MDYNNKYQEVEDTNPLDTFTPNDIDVVTIPNDIPEYGVQDYDMFDEKDMVRYMKDLERFVRQSLEYKSMVQYLREYMDMRNCAFLPNVTNEFTPKIRIEIHHSPMTLYEICSIIIRKRMALGELLTIEAVAYEVLYVHYCLMVGLIPLSETVHELVHNQYIYVPANRVYGYYNAFVQQYHDYIDAELLDKLKMIEKLAQDQIYNDYMQILEKKYIAIDMGDNSQVDQLGATRELLKQRLSILRDGNASYAAPPSQTPVQQPVCVPLFRSPWD